MITFRISGFCLIILEKKVYSVLVVNAVYTTFTIRKLRYVLKVLKQEHYVHFNLQTDRDRHSSYNIQNTLLSYCVSRGRRGISPQVNYECVFILRALSSAAHGFTNGLPFKGFRF